MTKLVDSQKLENLENLVESLHPVNIGQVKDVSDAFIAAEAESEAMREETGADEEWYHLDSRLGRYRYEKFGR